MHEHFISRDDAEADMLTAAAFIAERITSADGRAEAMNAIIPLYLKQGNVDLSAELANQVDEPYSRDRLLIQVAAKCAEVDDDEYALQLADAVEDQGLKAQGLERVSLIKSGKGDIAKAREIADSLKHPDFAIAGIAVRQAANGDEAGALATIDSIEFASARFSALMQIADAAIEGAKNEKAVDLLDRAVAAANEIEHSEEKIRSLCEAGTLLVSAKRNDKAIGAFDAAKADAERLENIHRDTLLVNAALGFLYSGSDELADRTLDLVTDKTQMATALLSFSREYWKRDEKEDAIDALDEAHQILRSQRDIETRDSRGRNLLMTAVAVQFAGYGDHVRAVEIAEQNQDPEEQMSGLAQIAQVLTLQGHDDIARQTVNAIDEPANQVFALIAMADAKDKSDDQEGSVAILNEAANLVADVPQHASRSSALNDLIARFAAKGQTEKARELGILNLAVIEEIRDESSRAAALAQLANVYESSGLAAGEEELNALRRLVEKVPF